MAARSGVIRGLDRRIMSVEIKHHLTKYVVIGRGVHDIMLTHHRGDEVIIESGIITRVHGVIEQIICETIDKGPIDIQEETVPQTGAKLIHIIPSGARTLRKA